MLDGVIVEEVAGVEVVGAIEEDVGGGEEIVDVGGDKVGCVGVDLNAGVECSNVAAGGFGFGERVPGVSFVEKDLALEVGGFNEVAVDQRQLADTCASEEAGGCGAGCAYTNDGGVGDAEFLLAVGADAGKEHLAGVALGFGDGLVLRHEVKYTRLWL